MGLLMQVLLLEIELGQQLSLMSINDIPKIMIERERLHTCHVLLAALHHSEWWSKINYTCIGLLHLNLTFLFRVVTQQWRTLDEANVGIILHITV